MLILQNICLRSATCETARGRSWNSRNARAARASREVTEAGIHRQFLTRLVREGVLEQVTRGVYRMPDQPVTEHHGLVLASAAIPKGVVCLLSALAFHSLGTQLPWEVWMAIPRRARQPT